ncbi:MAG: glycosyltransferase family 2 protein [Candidatus Kaiserbacteria bacterium]|nr:MAG: glycosyltransferase family 2 protein [Candidatus Kaiserbacteria bacterium]
MTEAIITKNQNLVRRIHQGLRDASEKIIGDAGGWFLFFGIIYVILIFKAVSYDSLSNHIFFGIYSILITSYILSRFLLAYLRKPVRRDSSYEPSVAFVVPAKNEEDNIFQTIERFGEVEYPREKIEVIAINDGSTDRTLREMRRAAAAISGSVGRVEVVDFKENRGKRYGMAEGAKRATHDIVIFIDSDSFIERDAVRHLVKYFADKEVGAVSGHTDVYNRDTNLLTQMQAIRYYIAFKVYKAAESVFGLVTCCPGCCSAYRRVYMMEFVDEWLHQKFLGKECTFGDDRSLTNFMIRKYRTVYAASAKAFTVVPDTFGKYVRQQQRWKKSWLRETFIAASFIWKKNPLAAFSFYTYIFLAFASPVVFFRAMIWQPAMSANWPVIYLIGLFLMLFLHGLYYRLQVGSKAWVLAIFNFWFNTVILMWQLPWALVTMRDTRWGTR